MPDPANRSPCSLSALTLRVKEAANDYFHVRLLFAARRFRSLFLSFFNLSLKESHSKHTNRETTFEVVSQLLPAVMLWEKVPGHPSPWKDRGNAPP